MFLVTSFENGKRRKKLIKKKKKMQLKKGKKVKKKMSTEGWAYGFVAKIRYQQ